MGRKVIEVGVLAITVLAIVVMFAILGSLFFVPYAPLTFYSMQVEEDEVCPEQSVKVFVDYRIAPSDFDGLRGIDVSSNWVAVDVEDISEGSKRPATNDQTIEPDMLQPGRSSRDSRVLRIAPQRPGVWRLENEVRVRGNKWGVPAPPQSVTEVADSETVVLDSSDSRCQQASRRSREDGDRELIRSAVYGSGAGEADIGSGDLAGVAPGEAELDHKGYSGAPAASRGTVPD